ncbi:flavodoxin [Haploplasma axanthum]|uniref:Flavodoxin n=1 Tax=Haploplasma axanthum TaxID=29552 RepID=A0A449BD27_HAPAX|nr:flavodoxin [Haploplasma axanthum]VEU80359.1 Flavodoxin [Haploplasma axanthum]
MEKAVIVYWSGTGNTEIMADKIKEGLEESGYETNMLQVYEASVEAVLEYDKIAFGCPSMGIEELEEEEFEPFFEEIETQLTDKKIALFGSYGWGDGEWMEAWEERVANTGAILFEKGLIINSTPSTEEEDSCLEFGKRFAEF